MKGKWIRKKRRVAVEFLKTSSKILEVKMPFLTRFLRMSWVKLKEKKKQGIEPDGIFKKNNSKSNLLV